MFSVVIPLYDKAAYVAETLRAVLAQTWSDYEVLVVDDGSRDGSGDVAREAFGDDPRFRLVRVANGGVAAARNHGALLTHRPWLVFLDADDTWHPEFLQALTGAIARCPDVVVASTAYEVNGEAGAQPLCFPVDAEFIENPPFFDWALDIGPPIWTSATAVRRDAFEAVGGFDRAMTVGEDIHLWVRLLQRGPHVLVNRPLAVYHRADGTSLSRVVSDKALASRERLIEFLDAQVHTGGVPRRYRDALREIHFCELVASSRYRRAMAFWRRGPSFGTGAAVRHVLRHLRQRISTTEATA